MEDARENSVDRPAPEVGLADAFACGKAVEEMNSEARAEAASASRATSTPLNPAYSARSGGRTSMSICRPVSRLASSPERIFEEEPETRILVPSLLSCRRARIYLTEALRVWPH
ncbi:MAG: hypothetical protein QXH42_08555 [Thermoplasmata archaeon]